MRKVNDADKLFYFQKNFFTLDGLWMLETEKEVGWETALKIDKNVWIKLMEIIFKRIKKYLNIKTNGLNDLVEILTFRWSVEGWKYLIRKISEFDIEIEINECPYKAIMDRNPERQDKIPLICKNMCIPFYEAILDEFNPLIKLERNEYLGLGNNRCNFHFTQLGK
ncbi:MAG: DUF6125 family protein [Candidatus Hermodarchaeota archaeon]